MIANKNNSNQQAVKSDEKLLIMKTALRDGANEPDLVAKFAQLEGSEVEPYNSKVSGRKGKVAEQNGISESDSLENDYSENLESYPLSFEPTSAVYIERSNFEAVCCEQTAKRKKQLLILEQNSEETGREEAVKSESSFNSDDEVYNRAEAFLDSHNIDIVIPGEVSRPKKFIPVVSKHLSIEGNQPMSDKSPLLSTVNASSLLLRRHNSPELKSKPSCSKFELNLHKTISLPLNLNCKSYESYIPEKVQESECEVEDNNSLNGVASIVDKITNSTSSTTSPTEPSDNKISVSKHQKSAAKADLDLCDNDDNSQKLSF